MKIHLIEKAGLLTREDKTSQDWESGNWSVSKETAESLIGGDIYLHKSQDRPSFFGGRITGYHEIEEGEAKGRVIFLFVATPEHKGVKTDKAGWGNEKKIVS